MPPGLVRGARGTATLERLGWKDLSQHIPSEYACANQVLFRETHAYRRINGDLPCIEGVTYDGVRHLMPLFDLAGADPDRLSALLADRDCFYPIPQMSVSRLDAARFDVRANEDDSDYVFHARAFDDYAAAGLSYKRSLRRHFEASSPMSADAAGREAEMTEVLEGWLRDVGREAVHTDVAKAQAAIAGLAELGLTGRVALLANGEPVGFVLASALGPACRVVHFAKGRRAHKGVYAFLFSELARHDPQAAWLNFEQDLGNPRFRQSKQSFMPAHRVVKYRVRPLAA